MIIETFWQRQKKLKGELPDVYVYDELPDSLRVQLVQITTEVLGEHKSHTQTSVVNNNITRSYKDIVEILRRDFGVFLLPSNNGSDPQDHHEELTDFILDEADADKVLSAVELICHAIEKRASIFEYRYVDNASKVAKRGIEEINYRMKNAGVGYEYDGQMVRIDTELLHVEAVKPALALLRDRAYAGPEEEFHSAYEHYRNGRHKEAITAAAKAFESTMKVILDKRGWAHNKNDNASKLVAALYQHDLIPSYWQHAWGGLRTLLDSAIPTPRNNTAAHGQGVNPTKVPDHMASYVLHMTASTIVFLVKSEKALP